jgi:guanylate kinase
MGLIIVVSGPGGVGKSTIVEELVARDSGLWLSRSWTTRSRRNGESADAYHFVDRATFEQRIHDGGFLEWTEFLGNLYGTPNPEPPEGRDIVLEIEVDGAQQVKRKYPHAILIFVLPPSRAEQEARLHARGDADAKVVERLRKAEEEEPIGKELADHVIVNDHLQETVESMLGLIRSARLTR